MIKDSLSNNQVQSVASFEALINTQFQGQTNAICWKRELAGDFLEIINELQVTDNVTVIEAEDLLALNLSARGRQAREVILKDLENLKQMGASPVLNVIKQYERDAADTFFPTDVYSFHVDRSPIPSETFLCTYYGAPSEIIANSEVVQKIQIPEIRKTLKANYKGAEEDFATYLTEYFFDLHYQALPYANILKLGMGELWKLAVDHPESPVLPCVHRAPVENSGEFRLLLIC